MCRYDYLIFSVIQFLDLWVRGQKVSEGHRTCLYYLRPWVCSTSDCEFLFSVVESSQKIIMDWLKVRDLNVVINFHPSPCPYSHFKLHQALLSWWNFKTTTISDILNYDKKKIPSASFGEKFNLPLIFTHNQSYSWTSVQYHFDTDGKILINKIAHVNIWIHFSKTEKATKPSYKVNFHCWRNMHLTVYQKCCNFL